MARTTFFLADMSRVDKNQKRGGVQGLFSLILSFTQFTRELLLSIEEATMTTTITAVAPLENEHPGDYKKLNVL